ncbi:MAG: FGGY family carbohydrate kinase, partial [Chloroflexota bacterium]
MVNGSYLLGLDVSTTAAKALLVDGDGQVLGSAANSLELSTPKPLWSEQNPADWWSAMAESIRQVLSKTGVTGSDIAAIGLTGQMHGLVLLDAQGEVLRPAILWNDQRTAAQCDTIREQIGREELIRICGNDALTGFTAPKILWVRDEEPGIYDQTRHVLLP